MLKHGAFLGKVILAPQFRLGSTQLMTDADEGLIETVQSAVVKFFANGCPPCGEYAPVFDEVANRTPADIMMVAVDIDESPSLYSKYDIQATPTTIFLEGGRELNRVEGKMTAEGLEAMMLSAFGESLAAPKAPEQEVPNGTPFAKPGPMPKVPAGTPAAAPGASAGTSKTLLVAGGIGLVGLVTGALLLAKG